MGILDFFSRVFPGARKPAQHPERKPQPTTPNLKVRLRDGEIKQGAINVGYSGYMSLKRWVDGGQADYWTMVDLLAKIKSGLVYWPKVSETSDDPKGDHTLQIVALLEYHIAAVKNPPPKPVYGQLPPGMLPPTTGTPPKGTPFNP